MLSHPKRRKMAPKFPKFFKLSSKIRRAMLRNEKFKDKEYESNSYLAQKF